MNRALRRAIDDWNADVEEEATRLILQGVPPFDAIAQARDRVSRRRALALTREEQSK